MQNLEYKYRLSVILLWKLHALLASTDDVKWKVQNRIICIFEFVLFSFSPSVHANTTQPIMTELHGDIIHKLDVGLVEQLFHAYGLVANKAAYDAQDEDTLNRNIAEELIDQRVMIRVHDVFQQMQVWLRDLIGVGRRTVSEIQDCKTRVYMLGAVTSNNNTGLQIADKCAVIDMFYDLKQQQFYSMIDGVKTVVQRVENDTPTLRLIIMARRAATQFNPAVVAAALFTASAGLQRISIQTMLDFAGCCSTSLILSGALYHHTFLHSNLLLLVVMDNINKAVKDAQNQAAALELQILIGEIGIRRMFASTRIDLADTIESIDSIVDHNVGDVFAVAAFVTTKEDVEIVITFTGFVTPTKNKYKNEPNLHRLTAEENRAFHRHNKNIVQDKIRMYV